MYFVDRQVRELEMHSRTESGCCYYNNTRKCFQCIVSVILICTPGINKMH